MGAPEVMLPYVSPHVNSLVSYIQDTADFLRSLDGICVPEGVWLVAIDVEALYNSITHKMDLYLSGVLGLDPIIGSS